MEGAVASNWKPLSARNRGSRLVRKLLAQKELRRTAKWEIGLGCDPVREALFHAPVPFGQPAFVVQDHGGVHRLCGFRSEFVVENEVVNAGARRNVALQAALRNLAAIVKGSGGVSV